jgi:hypothetical protein
MAQRPKPPGKPTATTLSEQPLVTPTNSAGLPAELIRVLEYQQSTQHQINTAAQMGELKAKVAKQGEDIIRINSELEAIRTKIAKTEGIASSTKVFAGIIVSIIVAFVAVIWFLVSPKIQTLQNLAENPRSEVQNSSTRADTPPSQKQQ